MNVVTTHTVSRVAGCKIRYTITIKYTITTIVRYTNFVTLLQPSTTLFVSFTNLRLIARNRPAIIFKEGLEFCVRDPDQEFDFSTPD